MSKKAKSASTSPAEAPGSKPAQPSKPKNGRKAIAKNLEIVKPSNNQVVSPAQSEKLINLAQGIRESHHSIGALSKTAKEKITETMDEVVRCGKMLSESKAIIGHGGWLKWLNENCKMGIGTAQAYMRVSRGVLPNNQRADYLEEPKSIRQAIVLLSERGEKSRPAKEKEASDANVHVNGIRHISILAKNLIAALHSLPRGQENEAFDAMSEIRDWITSESIPARTTSVS